MPCVPFKQNGARGFVCMAKPRRQKCVCGSGKAADLLCDWKVPGGTCDLPICAVCSHKPAPGKDLCPGHAAKWAERRK